MFELEKLKEKIEELKKLRAEVDYFDDELLRRKEELKYMIDKAKNDNRSYDSSCLLRMK